MANLMMVDYNYYSSVMFRKTKWISMEVAAAMIRPLLFAEGIYGYMIPKKSPGEGAKKKWNNAEAKGYHKFAPFREEFLALKEELGASWRTLGDYLEIDPAVLQNFWGDDKEYVSDEYFRLWKKRMAMIRSLSQISKAELFAPRSRVNNVEKTERAPFVLYVRRFRQDMGFSSWVEMADALGVSPDHLRGQVNDRKHKMMKKSTHDNLMARMAELAKERQRRANFVNSSIEKMYEPST
jgi:hypothetical protein